MCGLTDIAGKFAMELAGAGRPSARENILVDGCPIWMRGSQLQPALDVHAVSHVVEGMDPSKTPRLSVAKAKKWRS